MLKPGTGDWLRDALLEGLLSPATLARRLCELNGWRNRKGELCEASARKGLLGMAADLDLPLPPARRGRRRSRRRAQRGFPPVRLQCSLEEMGAVSLRWADTAKLRRHFGDLLAAEHPLGRGRKLGCRLAYGVRAGDQDVGVVSFVAAPMRLGTSARVAGTCPSSSQTTDSWCGPAWLSRTSPATCWVSEFRSSRDLSAIWCGACVRTHGVAFTAQRNRWVVIDRILGRCYS